MAESLGEKLREAREAKGISISEVAEQTRISPLYLESIENDDYRPLPGGIFNKGFVKSFARYVGYDEEQAVKEYAKIASTQEPDDQEQVQKPYKPEVLTDDSRGPSMLPTIIIAAVILGLMTWGILAFVKYLNETESTTAESNIGNSNLKQEVMDQEAANANKPEAQQIGGQNLDSINAVVKSSSPDGLSITSTIDGKHEIRMINNEVPQQVFDAKETLVLSYYKGLAETVDLTINGKKIETPMPPPGYRKNGFEYTISKANIKQIMQTGKIELGAPTPAADANANTNTAPQ
ncbi:MAG: helix-turn-helix domain-containing protein [Pyrinomonadaceae bacterium]